MNRGLSAFLLAVTALMWGRSLRRSWTALRSPHWPGNPEPAVWPSVSVIVPAWKERNTVSTCLSLLLTNDYPEFEVIVVAGGPDGTFEAVRGAFGSDPRVRVLEQAPRGKNAALNQALPLGTGDVIVFLDADSQIGPDWLRHMVAALQRDVSAASGNYFPLDETIFSLQGEMAKILEYEVRGRVIVQGSGGIAVRREALEAIGPFPEGAYSSDWDLDARLGAAGYRRAFIPGAVTYSHRPATAPEWWKNELRWRRLHLLSLFRLKHTLLRDPLPVARHLYPYVVAWSLIGASFAWLLLAVSGRTTARRFVGGFWRGLLGVMLARETASVIEVLAFTREPRWLRVGAATPLLAGAGWIACALASLSAHKATVHFKGPRSIQQSPGASEAVAAGPAGGVEAIA